MGWGSIVIYGLILIVAGIILLMLSRLFGPRRYKPEKMETYECGMPLLADARDRSGIRFYVLAIIFIAFDIEIVFLIPWAVLARSLGFYGLAAVGTFLGVLGLGLLYILRRGALELVEAG
jgi:NADH-quinone oxidoreductase subunit A